MQPFITVIGPAVAMPAANIDTDVIMPKQFLKGIDREGLAHGAFHHLRFDEAGNPRPDFDLNRPEWAGARFLVVGPNFGCGSSREHAVWGLRQLGIRAVIGTSFAGIFADNADNNGLLLVSLDAAAIARLLQWAVDPQCNRLTVDLPRQCVSAGPDLHWGFEIAPRRKQALLRGLDTVGTTLELAAEIRAFEAEHFAREPWLVR
jgi:3-isopropylmalate/(R)-2-methylmalate dehydratase small subunit